MNPIHSYKPPNTHKEIYHFFQKIAILLFLCSCETADVPITLHRGEYIGRLNNEYIQVPAPEKKALPPYPWKRKSVGNYPQITKRHFCCKGNNGNPDKFIDSVYVQDCGGCEQHSLPLRENKEFIYPILINLLNYVQAKEKKPIIITAGHRCPEHNRYNDASSKNQYSKHMIGAEVTFYVQGRENNPEAIVRILQDYFVKNPDYKDQPEYQEFLRWDKQESDISTLPWYNKEVFIKLYKATEGRDFDNDHPFSYIAIQVRYDRSTKERVSYSWDGAFRNYWRF